MCHFSQTVNAASAAKKMHFGKFGKFLSWVVLRTKNDISAHNVVLLNLLI
jgi:hypothetical protein